MKLHEVLESAKKDQPDHDPDPPKPCHGCGKVRKLDIDMCEECWLQWARTDEVVRVQEPAKPVQEPVQEPAKHVQQPGNTRRSSLPSFTSLRSRPRDPREALSDPETLSAGGFECGAGVPQAVVVLDDHTGTVGVHEVRLSPLWARINAGEKPDVIVFGRNREGIMVPIQELKQELVYRGDAHLGATERSAA